MKKKVLFVPGIYNPKIFQFRWRKECEAKGYEFLEFEKPFYGYWNFKKMQEMIREGRETIKKNDNLTVVCHSFGGILINVILKGLKKADVKKLVLITSPLRMNIFGMRKRKKLLGYDEALKYNFDVVSFGAYFDELVVFFWTRYGKEKHYDLFADHLFVLFSGRVVRKIMKFSGMD